MVNERRTEALQVALPQVFGAYGLKQWNGYVMEEHLNELSGEKWIRTLQRMVNDDALVGAMLFAIEMLIRQASWQVIPANDTDEAEQVAKFIEECLMEDMDISWQNTLAEILSFMPYGWAVLELLYKQREDGRIGWREWASRPQDTLRKWIFDPETGVAIAMVQAPPPDYRERIIPLAKCAHFRTSTRKGNPEGKSILRTAYHAWYYKKNIERIEAIGIERDLAGLPVIYAPAEILNPGAGLDERAMLDNLKNVVRNIRRDAQEGVIMPSAVDESGNKQYELELLSTGGSRQFDTNGTITRYKEEIAMSLLADFILLGHEAVGSYALSSDKTSLFATAMGTWLQTIAQTVNMGPIATLCDLNGYAKELHPTLKPGDIETLDLTVLGDYITKLQGAGITMFPHRELKEFLYKQANMPMPTEEEEAKMEEEAKKKAEEAMKQNQEMMQARAGGGGGGVGDDKTPSNKGTSQGSTPPAKKPQPVGSGSVGRKTSRTFTDRQRQLDNIRNWGRTPPL